MEVEGREGEGMVEGGGGGEVVRWDEQREFWMTLCDGFWDLTVHGVPFSHAISSVEM